MGHEIIVYRDRHVIVNDHDLWAIRHFLIAEAELSHSNEIETFVREWDWMAPGVYLGIEFDIFFGSDSEREQQFLKLLAGAARRIQSFGVKVPLDYLEKNINLPGAYFASDQPTDRWVDLLEKIRHLFATAQIRAK